MIHLETERLLLSPLEPSDRDRFYATNVSESVKTYLWDKQTIPFDLNTEIVATSTARFKEEGWGLWKLLTRDNQSYVGYAGLWPFFDESQPQLLYALDRSFEGRGYATEAAERIIRYAFQGLGFTYLTAAVDVGNDASVAVCLRLGFELEAQREQDGKPTLFFRLDRQGTPATA